MCYNKVMFKRIKTQLIEDEFDITPDISLMNKMSKQNYSVAQALNELIDNSIDSAEDLDNKCTVKVKYSEKDDFCIIEDNGSGMNKKELANAWTLAKSEKVNKMGIYGFGLKQASLNLGKQVLIETTKKGSDELYILEFDAIKWSNQKGWKIKIKTSIAEKIAHFTKITISKLNRISKFTKNSETRLALKLGNNYEHLILANKLEIKLNKYPCVPKGITLDNNFGEKLDDWNGKFGEKIMLDCGSFKIKGYIGVMLVGDQNNTGFRTYRQNRLITRADKFHKGIISTHPSQVRLFGELDMTPLDVHFNKTGWVENDKYQKFLEELEKCKALKEAKEFSRVKENKISIDKLSPNMQEKINKSFREAIEHKEIKEAIDTTEIYKHSQIVSKRKVRDRLGEKIESELRNKRKLSNERNSPGNSKKSRSNFKNTQLLNKSKIDIKIRGKRFSFEHFFEDLQNEEKLLTWIMDEDSKILNIFTNESHKIVTNYNNADALLVLQIMNMAHALTEYFIENNMATEYQNDFYEKLISEVTKEILKLDKNEIIDSKL